MNHSVPTVSNWRRAIPNLLTLGNALCGFTAILLALQAYEKCLLSGAEIKSKAQLRDLVMNPDILPLIFASCAWIILFAMVFDALDGWAARKLKSASNIGIEMDSLADMVTFGLTPAVVCYIYSHTSVFLELSPGLKAGFIRHDRLIWICTAVYASCAALRLARYNIKALEESAAQARGEPMPKSEGFVGIPSPGAAAGICSILLIGSSPLFIDQDAPLKLPDWCMTVFLPAYCLILGLLMVSHIPYPHVGKWLLSGKGWKRKLLVVTALVGAAAYEVWSCHQIYPDRISAPVITAAIVITLYIASGPINMVIKWIRGRRVHEDENLFGADE